MLESLLAERKDKDEKAAKNFVAFCMQLKQIATNFDVQKASKKQTIIPSRIPALPPMPDEKNKLRDLGLDVSHLNPRVKGCVMSALAQLDRIATERHAQHHNYYVLD